MVNVVLAAYNETGNIERLLTRVADTARRQELPWRIILVDDGSRDRTGEVARRFQGVAITVIEHPENRGLSAALRTGLTAALRDAADHDIVVTMDADDTHDPADIPRLIRALEQGHDVAIGSRFQPTGRAIGVSALRRLYSAAAGRVLRLCCPIPGVRDYTCGFRAYRVAALRRTIGASGTRWLSADSFACTTELLLKVHRAPARIVEIPVTIRYDRKQGRSKLPALRTMRDTLRLAWQWRHHPVAEP